jgi:ABC-type dipeptide/oligopeptide/nickel transport system permease component
MARPPLTLAISKILARAGQAVLLLLLAGFLGSVLIRLAPGAEVSEQELDPRLSNQTIEALRRARAADGNAAVFYFRFMSGLLRADAGESNLFSQPVAQLVRERLPITARSVGTGLIAAWAAALVFAAAAATWYRGTTALLSSFVTGTLLSIPSGVLAILCLLLNLAPAAAIAAVVFPRVFPYAYHQFLSAVQLPHVMLARARGIRPERVFVWHVVPETLPPLLAFCGVSIALAVGAAIPIEALADSPGIGQLAWRAALGRDVPVLVTVTLLLTAVTVFANLASDVAILIAGARRA